MDALDPALRRVIDQVLAAGARKAPLEIRGGGTKAFYGGAPRGELLDMQGLAGISSYEPTELVVTARAGTPLTELESTLAEGGQCLAFEPPRFAAGGTVGGMVAAGISGPPRAAVGCVRDFVLGATMLNGRGDVLSFGGQVMKNVAGYDVSRLLAGSMGVLGVICEVSLKVLPVAPATATRVFEMDQARALAMLNGLAGKPLPVNASVWHQGRLYLRLRGAKAAVQAACEGLGGAPMDADAAWWESVRDHDHPFFRTPDGSTGDCLWRLSLPDTTPPLQLDGDSLVEWGGAQRWLRSRAPAAQVRAAAGKAGGHAVLFRAADRTPGTFAVLSAPLMQIHRRVKQAFDPDSLFNPGRLYPDL